VRAVRAWLDAAAITEGWVFRGFDPGSRLRDVPLPAYQVARDIQRAVAQLGLSPADYGGYSLRAGLVTEAAKAGVPERVIMQQTGHTDVRTLRRYIRDGSLLRTNAAAQVGL
jgi:integrase